MQWERESKEKKEMEKECPLVGKESRGVAGAGGRKGP